MAKLKGEPLSDEQIQQMFPTDGKITHIGKNEYHEDIIDSFTGEIIPQTNNEKKIRKEAFANARFSAKANYNTTKIEPLFAVVNEEIKVTDDSTVYGRPLTDEEKQKDKDKENNNQKDQGESVKDNQEQS